MAVLPRFASMGRPCTLVLAVLLALPLLPVASAGRPNIVVEIHAVPPGSSGVPSGDPALGGGTYVQNDAGASLLVAVVRSIPDNCYVSRLGVWRAFIADTWQQDLAPADKIENRRVSDTFTSDPPITPVSNPPTVSGLFGVASFQETSIYVRAYVKCETSKGHFEPVDDDYYESAHIKIPEKHLDYDTAAGGSQVSAQGAAQASGGTPQNGVVSGAATGSVSAGAFRRGSWAGHTALVDPTLSFDVVTADQLPAGWTFEASPANLTLAPGQNWSVDLRYVAPTSGLAVMALKTRVDTPNGTYTTLSDPQLFLVDDAPARTWTAWDVAVGNDDHKVATNVSGGRVANVSAESQGTLGIHLAAPASGRLQVVYPKALVGNASAALVRADGIPVAATLVSSDSLYAWYDVPLATPATNVTVSPLVPIPTTPGPTTTTTSSPAPPSTPTSTTPVKPTPGPEVGLLALAALGLALAVRRRRI